MGTGTEQLELRWRQRGRPRLLFVVHGFREHPAAALMMGTILDPRQRTTLCAPRGGVDLGEDERAFYRIDAKARRLDPASFVSAVQQLDDALDRACEETGASRNEAVLAGFSQGAGLAMALSFRRSERPSPAAVVAMSAKLYTEIEEVD